MLLGLTVVAAAVATAAGGPLRRYLERRINESLDGYTVSIGGLDLQLVG